MPNLTEYLELYPEFAAYIRLVFGDRSIPRLLPPLDLQIISNGARRRFAMMNERVARTAEKVRK